MVEELYHDGGYRPPWLWSVADVLESTADEDVIVVSDPVGHGSDRGPHNCGECDDMVQSAIKDFDLRQDPRCSSRCAASARRRGTLCSNASALLAAARSISTASARNRVMACRPTLIGLSRIILFDMTPNGDQNSRIQ